MFPAAYRNTPRVFTRFPADRALAQIWSFVTAMELGFSNYNRVHTHRTE